VGNNYYKKHHDIIYKTCQSNEINDFNINKNENEQIE